MTGASTPNSAAAAGAQSEEQKIRCREKKRGETERCSIRVTLICCGADLSLIFSPGTALGGALQQPLGFDDRARVLAVADGAGVVEGFDLEDEELAVVALVGRDSADAAADRRRRRCASR